MSLSFILSFVLALEAAPEADPPAVSNPDKGAVTDQAQQHYDEGVELFRTERFEEAARAFERAYALVPESSLLYNISFAWEQAGELERALQYLERYAEESEPREAEQVATQLEGLRQRVAKEQGGPSPDDETSTSDASSSVARAEAPAAVPRGESATSIPEKDARRRVFTPLSAALLGAGIAGVGVGVGLAVVAWQQGERVREGCFATGEDRYVCPDSFAGAAGRSRGMAIGADVAFAVGGAALAAATVLLAVRGTRLRRETQRMSVTPTFGSSARSLGFAVMHRF